MTHEEFCVWLANCQLAGTIGTVQEMLIRNYTDNLHRHLQLFANDDTWTIDNSGDGKLRYFWDDASSPVRIAKIALGDRP